MLEALDNFPKNHPLLLIFNDILRRPPPESRGNCFLGYKRSSKAWSKFCAHLSEGHTPIKWDRTLVTGAADPLLGQREKFLRASQQQQSMAARLPRTAAVHGGPSAQDSSSPWRPICPGQQQSMAARLPRTNPPGAFETATYQHSAIPDLFRNYTGRGRVRDRVVSDS